MTERVLFEVERGDSPLLISVPHDGREIPEGIAARMTDEGLAIPDTDWHVARLYAFCREMGASLLVANLSRYVVDLNRPPDDAVLYPGRLSTGICPLRTFAGAPIYRKGEGVSAGEREDRVRSYWRPYHQELAAELARLKSRYGFALLWDAHSIAGRVPALFDGSLPDLSLGSDDYAACAPNIADAVFEHAQRSGYSAVHNGRFKGGYITRHYGEPSRGVHALQLELVQGRYMSEASLRYDPEQAERLETTLAGMLQAFIDGGLAARTPLPNEG